MLPGDPGMHQWNLSLQRGVGSNWVVGASYAGTNTIHLPTQRDLNPATFIPGVSTLANVNLPAVVPEKPTGRAILRRH
jgi:hypothetical protein